MSGPQCFDVAVDIITAIPATPVQPALTSATSTLSRISHFPSNPTKWNHPSARELGRPVGHVKSVSGSVMGTNPVPPARNGSTIATMRIEPEESPEQLDNPRQSLKQPSSLRGKLNLVPAPLSQITVNSSGAWKPTPGRHS